MAPGTHEECQPRGRDQRFPGLHTAGRAPCPQHVICVRCAVDMGSSPEAPARLCLINMSGTGGAPTSPRTHIEGSEVAGRTAMDEGSAPEKSGGPLLPPVPSQPPNTVPNPSALPTQHSAEHKPTTGWPWGSVPIRGQASSLEEETPSAPHAQQEAEGPLSCPFLLFIRLVWPRTCRGRGAGAHICSCLTGSMAMVGGPLPRGAASDQTWCPAMRPTTRAHKAGKDTGPCGTCRDRRKGHGRGPWACSWCDTIPRAAPTKTSTILRTVPAKIRGPREV